MNDYTLCCNIPKCRVPLNETAWVTRCMHVFCMGHGQAYFSIQSAQIECPVCNEINLKEVDIIQCEVKPSDMILAGIPPEKAICLASKSLKLWWSQIQEEHRSYTAKTKSVEVKNQEMKHIYYKMINKAKKKYEEEINILKVQRDNLIRKAEELHNELTLTQIALREYKDHDRSGRIRNVDSSSLSPHWFSNEDNLHRTSPLTTNNVGHGFTFNESHIFN